MRYHRDTIMLSFFKTIIKLFALSSLGILSACNGIVNIGDSKEAVGYEPVYSSFPLPYVFTASMVQWNEDYAVSAQHTPFLGNIEYRCSTGCDLVFIKHKATGAIPIWRSSILNEKISAYGNTSFYVTAKTDGVVLKTRFIQESSNNNKTTKEYYKLTSDATTKGMSGGPVYGTDGEVVGITLGFVNKTLMSDSQINLTPEIKQYPQLSYMLPTEIIDREWKKFQYIKNKK
jgi:hypothetical protein